MPDGGLVTCGGCGCACDDLRATVGDGRIDELAHACPLGAGWFGERTAPPPPLARVDGRESGLDAALDAAAALLAGARAPLVHGLGQASLEAQRSAVGIAEALGGVFDPVGPALDGAAGLAVQSTGSSTATFGEVRDRAHVVVAWRADPVVTHPRLLERLRLDRPGRADADDRTLVVVDAEPTATAQEADAFVALDPAHDVDALWTLRALVTGTALDRERAGHLPLDELEQLASRLRECRHGALLHGAGLGGGPGGAVRALALLLLVRDLSRLAHIVALPLRLQGNALGAEDVLAWQTGYPSAVSFARGYPRASPGEFSAAGLLERGEVDAALIVASDPFGHLPEPAVAGLQAIPAVVVDPVATPTAGAATVALAPAACGVHHEGTVHRMDGVPLPLHAPLAAERPSDVALLDALGERIAARLAGEAR